LIGLSETSEILSFYSSITFSLILSFLSLDYSCDLLLLLFVSFRSKGVSPPLNLNSDLLNNSLKLLSIYDFEESSLIYLFFFPNGLGLLPSPLKLIILTFFGSNFLFLS